MGYGLHCFTGTCRSPELTERLLSFSGDLKQAGLATLAAMPTPCLGRRKADSPDDNKTTQRQLQYGSTLRKLARPNDPDLHSPDSVENPPPPTTTSQPLNHAEVVHPTTYAQLSTHPGVIPYLL